MVETGDAPEKIARERGMVQVSDTSAIERIVDEVLAANPKPVEDYRNGKTAAFAFLMGQVMRQAKGKANPQVVREVLTARLGA